MLFLKSTEVFFEFSIINISHDMLLINMYLAKTRPSPPLFPVPMITSALLGLKYEFINLNASNPATSILIFDGILYFFEIRLSIFLDSLASVIIILSS